MQAELNNWLTSFGGTTPPVLAAIDSYWIIITAFVIGSAIVDWLKKRRQKEEAGSLDDQSQAPGPSAPLRRGTSAPPSPTPRPITSSWEEELRRLLSGEPPVTMPPPSSPPPLRPVIISTPAPPPVTQPRVTLKQSPPPMIVKLAQRSVPTRVIPSRAEETAEAPAVSLATLAESAGAYQRASQLHEAVGKHLQQVDAMTERHLVAAPLTRRRGISSDVMQVVSLLRSPSTARQAIVAAMILGPPKALETE